MISLKNVTVNFESKCVLNKLNADFEKGKIYAIMGDSGCGKTTILNSIAGLIKPKAGEIILPDESKISYVFQEPRLFDWLTVLQNVAMVIKSKKECAEIEAKKILCELALEDAINLYPHELSGGMKQRVAIARAIAYKPTHLLLDEPFAALDVDTKQKVASYMFETVKNCTVIMVTHNEEDTMFADEILKADFSPISELRVVKSNI